MEEITLEIPEDLKFMKEIPNIDWSILISRILKEKLEEIARLKRNLSGSKLTEKDIEELSDKINGSLSKRYS